MMRSGAILTTAVVLVFSLSTPLLAGPPKGGPPGKPPDQGGGKGEIRFVIELPGDALQVTRTPIEGEQNLVITSVDLKLDEPVFHPDIPGEPKLPSLQRLVALPRGATLLGVTVESFHPVIVEGVGLLEWGQPGRPGQKPPSQRPPIPPSLTVIGNEVVFYPSGDAFPPSSDYLKLAEWPIETTRTLGKLGGESANVIQLAIGPVRWHPSDQQLVFYTKQIIDVRYEMPKQQPNFKPRFADVEIADELRKSVVNPEMIPLYLLPFIQKIDAPYLIITDNFAWNEDKTRGDALDGDLVAEFERIADWKTRTGIRAKVVTVTDIVGGRYGNFAGDALDLQETLRNFLKHAREKWNTYWVLLGGGDEIIPPRVVLANAYGNTAHAILHVSDEEPPLGRAHWDAATRTLRVHWSVIDIGSIIYTMRDSTPFENVGWPSVARPGWGYATDETYRFPSFVPTDFVVIRGPLEVVTNAELYLDLKENRIPTDLYYASVDDPMYDVPGQRDWDANGNGIYGQNTYNGSIDGVSLDPDLAVGRVPVRNVAEARRWVDRVLEYEKYDEPAGFAERLLLLGDNWGATGEPATMAYQWEDLTAGRYYQFNNGSDLGRATIFFRGSVLNAYDWTLVSMKPTDAGFIPFNRNASPTSTGYYYNTDETFTARSEVIISILGVSLGIPVPTRFVSVYAPYDQINGSIFFFDNFAPDGVIVHKERVASVLATSAPAITEITRLYKDWYDFPGGADPALELTEGKARFRLGRGQNLVSAAGHGAPTGCCGLSIYEYIFGDSSGVFYADSCLTARFTDDRGSLAEALTVRGLDGVSAYIGNTAFSWIGMGNDFEAAFWEELRRNDSISAMHHTKARFQDWSTKIWANYALTLIGDPSMRIWRAVPQELVVELPATVTPGTRLRVRVTTMSGESLTLTRVAMTGANTFEVALTGLDGWAEFPPVLSPGEVTVVVAPSGYVPSEHIVTITP